MFLTIWDPFGPIWTLLDHFKQKWFFAQKHLRLTRLCPFGEKIDFLPETVQKCPDGPKRVPNGQKHLGWPFWTLLDTFRPLRNVDIDKPVMFSHFWAIPSHERCKKVHHQVSYVWPAWRTPKHPVWNIKMTATDDEKSKKQVNIHVKWPSFPIILSWMASYGSKTSFLLIWDHLVKVSWKLDARKCQNQVTPPYFD